MKAVLLNSGGMDTFLLAHHLNDRRVPHAHVFVDVGQKYAHKELNAALRIAASVGAELHRVRGAQIAQFEHASGIIPFRNAELILCAAQHGDDIYMGVIADEINSDKSEVFMQGMEAVLNESHRAQYWTEGRRFRLLTPLRSYTKTLLVQHYVNRGRDIDALLRTVSCYSESDQHCGNCSSCFKRWVALTNARVPYPADHFLQDPALFRSKREWRETLPKYSLSRRAEVEQALHTAGVLP